MTEVGSQRATTYFTDGQRGHCLGAIETVQNLRQQDEQASCVEVGLVKRVHTLFVRNAQQVVYELQVREEVEGVRQEVPEVKGRAKSKRVAHFMSACG